MLLLLNWAISQTGYLQEWNPENGSLTNSVEIDESLASLAVRDDGRFVAVGTMFTGSVSIYIAFSLQRVLHIPAAHSMFVTGLEFLPLKNVDGPPISSNTEAAVISISVDNKVCIHSFSYRRKFQRKTKKKLQIKWHIISFKIKTIIYFLPLDTLPAWLAILMIISTLFLTFTICSYMGL